MSISLSGTGSWLSANLTATYATLRGTGAPIPPYQISTNSTTYPSTAPTSYATSQSFLSGSGLTLQGTGTPISPYQKISTNSTTNPATAPTGYTTSRSFLSGSSLGPISHSRLNQTSPTPTGYTASRSFPSRSGFGTISHSRVNKTLSTGTPTSATNSSSSSTSDPYCVPFEDPDSGVKGTYCTCNDGGFYSIASGSNLCPYSSPVPASLTIATPFPPSPTPTVCQTGLNPNGECWNALKLTDYVNNWWAANSANCSSYPGFADCWYALKTIYAPSTCDQLNTDPACKQPAWNDFKDRKNAAKDFYVSWAIWNTQGFFLDLYNAIGDASGPVGDNAGAIVLALDPPQSSKTSPWEYVLDALTFGLSLYSEGSIIVKALLRSLPQSSTLSHNLLFPEGSVNGQLSAWTDVQQQMGNITSAWQKSVGAGLPELVNNLTAFTSWGEQSVITGIRESLDGLTTDLSQSLGAWMISNIVGDLDIVVTRAENLDVSHLQNAADLKWDTGCDTGYDSNGLCGPYFFDGTDTYSLTNANKMDTDYTQLFQQLFGGSNPLTTGALFFSGGYQCTATCGQNGGCNPSLTADGTPMCISTIQVCTWTWDTEGPFQDGCQNGRGSDAVLPRFCGYACISNEENSRQCAVPWSYLGGGIIAEDYAPGYWNGSEVCHTKYNT